MISSKALGGIFIISGTTIGGSMLALPIASAGYGFFTIIVIMTLMWLLMYYTALLTLEANDYYGKGVSVSYLSELILGKAGYLLSTLSIIILFYSLLSAYISGGASILKSILPMQIAGFGAIIIFSSIFGLLLYFKTDLVDLSNRFLLLLKLFLFLAIIYFIMPYQKLENVTMSTNVESTFSLLSILPIFFTSFGFHGSIPVIVNYVGINNKDLIRVFTIGSLIPLLTYIIWEYLVLAVIPSEGEYSFKAIAAMGGNVDALVYQINHIANMNFTVYLTKGFTFLAIVTSFLGVGMGLLDFVAEQLSVRCKSIKSTSLLSWCLTFIPPTIIAIFLPNIFVGALEFAAIALSFLAVIIPSLLVIKIRNEKHESFYGPIVALAVGLVIIVIEIWKIIG